MGLEKRLGVLMTVNEVRKLQRTWGYNVTTAYNEPEKNDAMMRERQALVTEMMRQLQQGVKFNKHSSSGFGFFKDCYVRVHRDRLYWSEKPVVPGSKPDKSRSFELIKIRSFLIGRHTDALKRPALDYTDDSCCFTVLTKTASLDLSSTIACPQQVRTFVCYMLAVYEHFQEMKDAHADIRISHIGRGFGRPAQRQRLSFTSSGSCK